MTSKIHLPLRAVALAGIAICACLTFSGFALAQAASLRVFEGAWTGSGTLSYENGSKERMLCRVDYVLRGPQTLAQSLQCQNQATNFNIVSNLTAQAGKLVGDWTETTHQAGGTLAGTLRGGDIRAEVQGSGFTAGVGIGVRGNKQTVSIRVSGADISGVEIALTRAQR